MRLLFLTQDFPPDVGGTQTYALELARRFAPLCDDFAVMAPVVDGCESWDKDFPFDVYRVRSSYDSFSVRAFPLMRHLVRRREFEASFHVQWPSAVSALLVRRVTGLRHIFVAAHGRELLLDPLPSPVSSVYRGLRRRILVGADHLFPVSRYTGSLLEASGVPAERITVVSNGTDTTQFAPADATIARRDLGTESRRVILTVSRLVPRKGIDTVLRALPRVAEEFPETIYLIGGTGTDRERLERLAADLGISTFVRFLGRLSDEELPLYYNACDLFVMPSRSDAPNVEGFGIVFLEANACGKPVIGADTGGIPDAIRDGETGLLVPPDDPRALFNAILRIFRDPVFARRLGEQGRDRVVREATWDHVAGRIFASMLKAETRFANSPL